MKLKKGKAASIILKFFLGGGLLSGTAHTFLNVETCLIVPQSLIGAAVQNVPVEPVLKALSLDSNKFFLEKKDSFKNSVCALTEIGVTYALYKSGRALCNSEKRISQFVALYCLASCFVYPKVLIFEKTANFTFKKKYPKLFSFCLYTALGLFAWKARLLSKDVDVIVKLITYLPTVARYMFSTKII